MEQPNYYAIIPATVRYDTELTANAKLLYGEITALCDKEGYCWATNEYFSKLYQTSERTVIRNLKLLESKKYIEMFYQTNGVFKKRYITTDKNVTQVTKMSLSNGQKCHINNTSNNIKEINNNNKLLLFTKKSFEKPTLEEVKAYCKERKNSINAEKFINYYESNGWKVGKNQMKDWKACIRTWESNEKKFDSNNKKQTDIIPDWFNKDIKTKEATEKEIKEMEKLLSKFSD